MARRSIEKAQRCRQGYAVLLTQLSQMVRLARQDPNIGAMFLYGSLARLQPRLTSDVDLLVLCLVTDLDASDLPIALLNNIAQDGVLLYQREGTMLPDALAEPLAI